METLEQTFSSEKKMSDKRQGWLKELKPGSLVIVKTGSYRRVETITKITKTGRIIIENKSETWGGGIAISKKQFSPDGWIINHYDHGWLEEATPEAIAALNKKNI